MDRFATEARIHFNLYNDKAAIQSFRVSAGGISNQKNITAKETGFETELVNLPALRSAIDGSTGIIINFKNKPQQWIPRLKF